MQKKIIYEIYTAGRNLNLTERVGSNRVQEKSDNEKRIYPRHTFKKTNDLVFKIDYGKQKLLNLDPINLSVGGIGGYIYNCGKDVFLNIGQNVTIYFYNKEKKDIKQRIDAKICWKYYDEEKNKFFFGKQFDVITLDTWQKLLHLTEKQN